MKDVENQLYNLLEKEAKRAAKAKKEELISREKLIKEILYIFKDRKED